MAKSRIKKNACLGGILFLLIGVGMLSSCGSSSEKVYHELSDFSGSRFGCAQGAAFPALFEEQDVIKDYTFSEFDSFGSMIQGVYSDKIDGFITDKPLASAILDQDSQKGLTVFPETVVDDNYGIVFDSGSPYVTPFNAEIAALKEDGTVTELESKWLDNYAKDPVRLTQAELTSKYNSSYDGTSATLSFGGTGKNVPMWYLSNEEAAGFDVEMIAIICTKLNYSYSFKTTYANTTALIAAVQAGDITGAAGSVSITPEREEKVDFTDPTYEGGAIIIYKKNSSTIEGPDDLNGKNVGVLLGSVFQQLVEDEGIVCNFSSLNSISDCVEALSKGRIDAYIDDSPSALYTCSNNAKVKIAKKHLNADSFSYGFMLNKDTGGPLKTVLDDFLAESKQNGLIDRLQNKWLEGNEERTLRKSDYSFSGPTLVFATNYTLPPFAYQGGTDYEACGYEIELIYEFCQEKGYTPDLRDMNFDAILASVSSGKADAAACSITMTEERSKSFLFSEPDYENGYMAILVSSGTGGTSFFSSLGTSFYRTFVLENRWKLFLEGYGVTLLITIASAFLGTIIGLGICELLISKKKALQVIGKIYNRIMQGVPIVVILMVLFYLVFASLDIPSILVAIIGFGMSFGAEVGEILKSGISSVDKGEIEASVSMGFSRKQTGMNVTMPQAIKNSIGVYMSSLTSMMKSTSVVGYIAIMDLTRASDLIRSRTFEAFFPLIAISIIYFLTSWGFFSLTKLLEKKLLSNKKKDYSSEVKGNG